MEGLIPMMFKAIKRNQTRRQYRCLSNGASSQSYELFYDDDHHHHVVADATRRSGHDPCTETRGGQTGHRRRFGSMGDYEMRSSSCSTSSSNGYNNFNTYGDYDPNHNHINGVGNDSSSNNPPPNMEFKRNRSHSIFSCITGEAY